MQIGGKHSVESVYYRIKQRKQNGGDLCVGISEFVSVCGKVAHINLNLPCHANMKEKIQVALIAVKVFGLLLSNFSMCTPALFFSCQPFFYYSHILLPISMAYHPSLTCSLQTQL